jgi:hypothetical protein
MDINDLLNGENIKLDTDTNKLLQVLLVKAILNDAQLKQVLIQLALLNSKIDGLKGPELQKEAQANLIEIIDEIYLKQKEEYIAILNLISSN